MDLKVNKVCGCGLNDLVRNREHWRILMNILMNLLVN
jgi:hypothetical protein